MVTQEKLRETDKRIRTRLQATAKELQENSDRIENKMNGCVDQEVNALLLRMVELGEQVQGVGRELALQDTEGLRKELQGVERRWELEMHERERRLEGMINQQESRCQNAGKATASKMQTLASRVDDALVKIAEQTAQAPWKRQVEEAINGWQKDLQDALADRPTTRDLSAYTTLGMTEKIVTQLANLQVRSDEQYNGLQGGLNTLERLYLRQLDQAADMVSLPNEVNNSFMQ